MIEVISYVVTIVPEEAVTMVSRRGITVVSNVSVMTSMGRAARGSIKTGMFILIGHNFTILSVETITIERVERKARINFIDDFLVRRT